MQNDAVLILVIIISGGVIITPVGLIFVLHKRPWFLRRRYRQSRRR